MVGVFGLWLFYDGAVVYGWVFPGYFFNVSPAEKAVLLLPTHSEVSYTLFSQSSVSGKFAVFNGRFISELLLFFRPRVNCFIIVRWLKVSSPTHRSSDKNGCLNQNFKVGFKQ